MTHKIWIIAPKKEYHKPWIRPKHLSWPWIRDLHQLLCNRDLQESISRQIKDQGSADRWLRTGFGPPSRNNLGQAIQKSLSRSNYFCPTAINKPVDNLLLSGSSNNRTASHQQYRSEGFCLTTTKSQPISNGNASNNFTSTISTSSESSDKTDPLSKKTSSRERNIEIFLWFWRM